MESKEKTLKQVINLMNQIKITDDDDKYNVYFEGMGNGKVKIVIESKIIEIQDG